MLKAIYNSYSVCYKAFGITAKVNKYCFTAYSSHSYWDVNGLKNDIKEWKEMIDQNSLEGYKNTNGSQICI